MDAARGPRLLAEGTYLSLADAAAQWLSYCELAKAAETYRSYRTTIHRFVAALPAGPIASLAVGTVTAWLAGLYDGRRRGTVAQYASVIKSFLKYCYRQGWT